MPSTAAPPATMVGRVCVLAAAFSFGIFSFAPFPALAGTPKPSSNIFGIPPGTPNSPKVCAMLSPSDLRSLFGKSWVVVPDSGIGPTKHCSWGPRGGTGALTVEMVPAEKYIDGDTAVAGIGDKAHLDDVIGMWRGRAVKGKNAVNFFTRSKGVSRQTALAVLKQLVAHM
jgi:hypothetical protein